MFISLPETLYLREAPPQGPAGVELKEKSTAEKEDGKYGADYKHLEDGQYNSGPYMGTVPSLSEIMATWPKKSFTRESVFKLPLRSLILILLPSVLWASLVMSVLIGFLVAISTNLSVAFAEAYQFSLWQTGLCNVANIIGAAIAVFFGGKLSDMVVDFLASKNNGIKNPQMRLPPMLISVITGPLSLVLYGLGIERGWHWIVPTIGLGLRKWHYLFHYHPHHFTSDP
jgi:hypothetical protein